MNTEKRVRFNVIDFFIIISLVTACCFFVYFTVKQTNASTSYEDRLLSYSVKIEGISESTANLFDNGHNVTNTTTHSPAGTIVNVNRPYHTYVEPSPRGDEYVVVTDEHKFDAIVTIETTFTQTDSSFIVAGEPLKVGSEISLFTDKHSFTGTVCDISLED